VCVKQKHSTRARRSTQQRQLNTRSTGESGLAAPHSGLPPALALIHKPGTPHHPRPPHRTTCTLMPPNASAHLGRHDDACRLLPLPRTVPLCTYECLCVAHAEQAGERPAQAARPPPPRHRPWAWPPTTDHRCVTALEHAPPRPPPLHATTQPQPPPHTPPPAWPPRASRGWQAFGSSQHLR